MNEVSQTETSGGNGKKKRQIPDVLVILFIIMILAAILTYIIPSGEYQRETDNEGNEVIVNGTYQTVSSHHTGLMDLFYDVFGGMTEAAGIIFLILLCGGSIGILSKTGVIDKGINRLIEKTNGSEVITIPVLLTLFALAGATFGMAEEGIVYIAILVPLVLRMGFDSIVAAALPILGSAIGYAGAFLNPFNLGVAHEVSGLPLFSGMPVRVISWLILLIIGIVYLTRYAMKVKKDPKNSLVYEDDLPKRESLENESLVESRLNGRDLLMLVALALTLIVLPIGIAKYGWYLQEISGVFLLMGVVVGIIGKLNVNEMAEAFVDSSKDLIKGALAVGFAFGIVVILQNGYIIDTIIYGLSGLASHFSTSVGAAAMLVAQTVINVPVNSGSGQAALTIPIMAPLADVIGVQRQTAVLAFQFGDGFTNAITPTNGGMMAGIAIAGVSWLKWAKFLWPLMVIFFITCLIMVTIVNVFVWPA